MNRAGIRIGVDVREMQDGLMTGIGRCVLNFLKMAGQYKPEWEFILFGNQHTSAALPDNNFKKLVLKEKFTFCWDQVKLPLAVRQQKIDLFFSPYNKCPLLAPCKVVITIHDLTPFLSFFPQESTNPLGIGLKRRLSSLFARRANLIIADSNNSRKDIVRLLNIAPEKIKVVYQGVEDRFRPVKDRAVLETIRGRYGLAKDYILYIGNLKPHKNVSGLIKAYAILPEDLRQRYQMVIVGKKDKNFSYLFKLCNESKIIEKVLFIDFVKDDDLPALYSLAAIFVFPSFYEGFGLPVLEAMACGVPVVSSCAASLPEVTGDAARLIDPFRIEEISQAIKEILTNQHLRESLSMRGLRQSIKFSPGETAKNILGVMEGLF